MTAEPDAAAPIAPPDRAPLSFGQHRLWLLAQLGRPLPEYNVPQTLLLRGELDTSALEAAFSALVRRHASLRTSIADDGDRPEQAIAPAAAFVLPRLDASAHADPLGEARRLAAELSGAPFELARGPLFRAALIQLGPRAHVLSVTLSHFVCDGWSLGVLWSELAAAYGAHLRGDTPSWPELPLQLGDYAALQRGRYEAAAERLRAYWKARLEGAPVLQLPTDRPRPLQPRHRGAKRAFALDAAVLRRLEAIGVAQGASTYMVLLAAFAAVLARHTGQDDVVIGSPTAQERGRPEVKPIIGMTANMLVLRIDLAGAPSFRELLQRVRDVVLGACLHADMPFEQIVAELRPERDPSRNPLFDVVFVLDEPGPPVAFEGLASEPLEIEHTTTKFDVTVALSKAADGLRGVIEYDVDLFDESRIARLLQHFTQLLGAVADAPDRPVHAHVLRADGEDDVLRRGLGRRIAHPHDRLVHELVAAQAAQRPDALAVVSADARLDYATLESRANRLAHHLRAVGVGPGVLAGVLLDRTPEMVATLLAVWKAGGAYVPLDPAQPPARQAAMIEDAATPVLLTREGLLPRLPATTAHVLCVDRDAALWAALPRTPPRTAATADDLAYVIFTSGSTGRPKGVEIAHRALLNLLLWHGARYGVTPADRASMVAGLGFDAAVWELWPYLIAGACVLLPDDEVRSVPARLLHWLADERITLSFAPTPLAEAMLAEPLPEGLALRALLTGGDRLGAAPARALPFELVNHYGPTECTVVATSCAVAPGSGPPPIGVPIDNVQCHVLDAHLQPTPVGVPGELYLGGAGLARGYRGQPAATAERFVPHPEHGRLLRTGDRVLWRADGMLAFLGRIDGQVQVRGHRVELGEIERVLRAHPDVSELAVVAQRRRSGELQLAAYVVARPGRALDAAAVRRFAAERLPGAMVPAVVVRPALPLAPNGKVDRKALAAADARAEVVREDALPPAGAIEERIAAIWRAVLELPFVGRDDNLFELGGHSLHAVQLRRRLAEAFGVELTAADVFRDPTVAAMARRLAADGASAVAEPVPAVPAAAPARSGAGAIAVIGMAGRFPQARDLDRFWDNLCAGRESISFFSVEQLRASGAVSNALLENEGYVPARAILEDIDLFDAAFFSISPRDAARMDPQVRLFLETAWTAVEDAGYDPLHMPGRVGVYGGGGPNSYERNNLAMSPAFVRSTEGFDLSMAGWQFLTMRVSHKLDLTGPSIEIHAASSTSLVAVVQACQALLGGHCDMALAGGISLAVPQIAGHLYREGEINSPDGHCRPFDAKAQGTVSGEGVGVVVLKPLEKARRDGDTIRAVIAGTGLNNDGAKKVGFTAPSVEGQCAAILAAHEAAGIDPATIGYVECHGTATQLGDTVEIAALTQAFRRRTQRTGYCAIGSLKSNLGHLDAAAGVAGLIKATLALERERIPPSLHFERPNPEIDFARSPFFVNAVLRPWPRRHDAAPRLAAVSSFGVGGTNAHVVLEEAPPAPASAPAARALQLLVLAAKTAPALERRAAALAAHLRLHPAQDFADVAWTTQVGRTPFKHRLALVAADADEAAELLEAHEGGRVVRAVQLAADPPVAFLFPGQGAQQAGAGRALYDAEPAFRDAVDRCCALLEPELGLDLRGMLFAPGDGGSDGGMLAQTRLTQPAMFVLDFALARLWMAWGVHPQAMLGHSVGEYVAACLAGVFALPDALRLVAARGRLMQELPAGAMLAVPLAEQDVLALLDGAPELSLAAVNGPVSCVVAGPRAAVHALRERLAAQRVPSQPLRTSHAFHSPMVEPILEPFAALLAQTELGAPRIACVSTVTGDWVGDDAWSDPAYWVRQLREPVRFHRAAQQLGAAESRILLEVGPGQTLSALCKQHGRGATGPLVLASLPHARDPQPEPRHLLATLARLWCAGVPVDWRAFAGPGRRRVPLPTYPFERKRHWIEPAPPPPAGLRREADPARWFWARSWQRRPVPRSPAAAPARGWLVFADETGLAAQLVPRLRARTPARDAVVEVRAGEAFCKRGENAYEVRPGAREDHDALLRDLAARGAVPERIAHMWGVVGDAAPHDEALLERCFYSLLWLGQALAEHAPDARIGLEIVTDGLFGVIGDEGMHPLRATALGPCRVLPAELKGLRCRLTDVARGEGAPMLAALAAEWEAPADDRVVAYRGRHRWVMTHAPLRLEAPATELPWSRPGCWLITGGTGGVGLALAELLARAPGTGLVLVARRPLPPPAAWEQWLSQHGEDDRTSRRIRRLQALQRTGAALQLEAADVADIGAMRGVIARARARFGALRGVVHAAGLATGGMVAARTRDGVAEVLAPKVHGTRVLHELLRDEPLELFALCSSIATVTGGVGSIDYTAANAFLDALAQQPGAHPWPVLSLGWDVWGESGMAVDVVAARGGATASERALLRNGLSDAEGRDVFARAVASGEPYLLVSTLDLHARLDEAAPADAATPVAEPEPELELEPDEAVTPRSRIEHALAAVAQEALGVASIGRDDDFFDLGLDSLVGYRMIARLRKEHGIVLTMRTLLASPTIGALGALVGETAAAPPARAPAPADAPDTAAHPWLGAAVRDGEGRHVWSTRLGPQTHWVLGEHRVAGRPVAAGGTYVELAHAAFTRLRGAELGSGRAVELRNVCFVRPLAVDDGTSCIVRTVLADAGAETEFVVESRPDGADAVTHAAGQIAIVDVGPAPVHDLARLRAACSERERALGGETHLQPDLGVAFGSRWSSARHVWLGAEKRLMRGELDPALAAEDRALVLHPALLDVAVAHDEEHAARMLLSRYDRVLVRGPIPARFYGITVPRPAAAPDEIVFDVTILDERGTEVVQIEGYTVRRPRRGRAPAAAGAEANATLVIRTPGLLEELAFVRTRRRAPGPGEVEVEVGVAGLNFKDVLFALGSLPTPHGGLPELGFECAGTVARVGEGAAGLAPGDAVVAVGPRCFSAWVTVPASCVARVPAGLELPAAATIPVAFLTAWQALVVDGQLQRGEKVLIHAAAGGVGLAAVQIAQWIGAEIFATAGSEAKRAFLRARGIAHVMSSRTPAFADEVRACTGGRGVDVVLNALAGDQVRLGLAALAPGGRFLELGAQDARADGSIDPQRFAAVSYTPIVLVPRTPAFDAAFGAVLQRFGEGALEPLPYRSFAAAQAADAFRFMASAQHIGKVVVAVEGRRALALSEGPR